MISTAYVLISGEQALMNRANVSMATGHVAFSRPHERG